MPAQLPTGLNGSLRNEVYAYEMIVAIRRRIFLMVGLCILAFVTTFWYSERYFIYQSKVIVDVSPAPVFLNSQEGSKQSVDIFKNSEYVMRILQFAHSNKMADHLIEKFNLYKHYGITPTSKYAYEKVNLILNRVILVKKSLFDNVVITVIDKDRDFAALMANEVAVATDKLAREYFSSALAGRMIYYEEILKNLNEDFSRKTKGISDAIAAIRLLKQSSRADSELVNKLSSAENNLLANTSQMNELVNQISELKKSKYWILSMMTNKEISFVSVMQKAIPDQSNLLFKKTLLSGAAMLSIFCISILFLYFAKTYRPYFTLFFARQT